MENKNHPDGKIGVYERYHIETAPAPDLTAWPSRFKVKVGKTGLARLLIRELLHTRFDMDVVLSRPCMYGVFSGPVGGFAPREELCVGCLRCTTEFPDFVSIHPNPERRSLGDSYFNYRYVEAVAYEAEGGRIPVKGAGYRGRFGGEGWDGMWTDMSEIVRPTRDGIHGREFISTVVDIGASPSYLSFDKDGEPQRESLQKFSIPLPFIFDVIHAGTATAELYKMYAQAAAETGTLVVIPLDVILEHNLRGVGIVPLVKAEDLGRLAALPFTPRMIELDGTDAQAVEGIRSLFPETVCCVRMPFGDPAELLRLMGLGVSVFHLTADYHGRGGDGRFIFDLIREAHTTLVKTGLRDRVTLLGSGGIVASEHVPKAIIAGLDAVALDVPLLVALLGRLKGEFTGRNGATCELPRILPGAWGVQRIKNLSAAWRDQLLEVLGAMGLREVRRLRGEMGRALFMVELEREAFAGIEGFDGHA